MIPANKVKEISSKIHDTTISDWADTCLVIQWW
jgi:hypothetical protein